MKCPKCDGELKVYRTIVDNDYIDVDLACELNEDHVFWCRLHNDDLIEA